ncbi:hypothetical protein BH10PSE2_BH10PSE2_26660 [soil metagenome]
MKSVALTLILTFGLALAGCGKGGAVNAPTQPAKPVTEPGPAPGVPAASGSAVTARPGTGPVSFVGRWSENVAWCAAPSGAETPITITPVRFEDYQNSCHIYSIDQTASGYQAALQCINQGQPRNERVSMSVIDQVLTLTYLDRGPGAQVKLTKCTTLGDVSAAAPVLPVGTTKP